MRTRPSHIGAAVALSTAIAAGYVAAASSGSDAAESARQAVPAEKRSIGACQAR
jgi:hypothetical protein